MVDLKFQEPSTDSVTVDEATLAAIQRGKADVEAGRTVSIEEVSDLIPVRFSEAALTDFEEILAYSWEFFPTIRKDSAGLWSPL